MVVVVDNHSADGTLAIARELADRVVVSGPERSAQRNAGARLASTPIVGFIDADMVLSPDVISQVAEVLLDPTGHHPVGVVVAERSIGEGFWAAVRAFERSFYLGSDSIEAARFFRREVFESIGGFDGSMPPGGEDWDLTQRARHVGAIARIQAFIDHDEGRPGYLELCRKKAYYAGGLQAYIARYGFGSIAMLDRPYVRRPWVIGRQGWSLGAGLLALKFGEAGAVCMSLLRSRWARR
jgi:glycosyltransferase involved in cell wall biosynthesis